MCERTGMTLFRVSTSTVSSVSGNRGEAGLRGPKVTARQSSPLKEYASMTDRFLESPVLNSSYSYSEQHWKLNEARQPNSILLV